MHISIARAIIVLTAISLASCSSTDATLKASGADPLIAKADFDSVLGDDWSGSLTYLNYSEPFEEVTIPAEIDVSSSPTGLTFSFQYPEEPQQNSTLTIDLSGPSNEIRDAKIVRRSTVGNSVIFMTVEPCEDMGREANCEMIYALAPNMLNIVKVVTYDGETESFQRNAYAFSR